MTAASLSAPDTKAGKLQRACLALLQQHEREGTIPTARAEARAALWAAGEIDLHQAVDELQAAAVRDGLIDELGQDRVQAIMVAAFAPVRDDFSVVEDVEFEAADNWQTLGQAAAGGVETTFAAACAAADEKQARKPPDPRLEKLRRLMDADVSLERVWNELNARAPGDVPTATLRAAEYPIQQGDAEHFREWLARHNAQECEAICEHLRIREARQCRSHGNK